jgi:hypothetical protein
MRVIIIVGILAFLVAGAVIRTARSLPRDIQHKKDSAWFFYTFGNRGNDDRKTGSQK